MSDSMDELDGNNINYQRTAGGTAVQAKLTQQMLNSQIDAFTRTGRKMEGESMNKVTEFTKMDPLREKQRLDYKPYDTINW